LLRVDRCSKGQKKKSDLSFDWHGRRSYFTV
jgi:hypothetical protein